jgi:hypothetical protein
VELQLNLTEKDYRAIADRRANRYVWKSGAGRLLIVGFVGVFIALGPYLLTPDDYNYTIGQILPAVGVFGAMIAVMFIFAGRVGRIENSILAKWGIKNKKGERWASK